MTARHTSRNSNRLELALYRAIADSTRRSIMDRLMDGEATAGELAGAFPAISRPAISRHLRLLQRGRLVTHRRDGRNRVYTLTPQPLTEIDAWLARYRLFWTARLHDLKAAVEERRPLQDPKP